MTACAIEDGATTGDGGPAEPEPEPDPGGPPEAVTETGPAERGLAEGGVAEGASTEGAPAPMAVAPAAAPEADSPAETVLPAFTLTADGAYGARLTAAPVPGADTA